MDSVRDRAGPWRPFRTLLSIVVSTSPAFVLAAFLGAQAQRSGWLAPAPANPTERAAGVLPVAPPSRTDQVIAADFAPVARNLTPRADAGEDQIGLVGRRLVLDAYRSEPRGAVGYRWIQVLGPPVQQRVDEGSTLAFVPPEPGLYRFVLVVGADKAVSEPDLVDVQVGTWGLPGDPAAAANTSAAAAPAALNPAPITSAAPPAPLVPPLQPPDLEQVARACLASVVDGPDRAHDLAADFEQIADRVELYTNYRDLFSELSRRLDQRVPSDPALRQIWLERVFGPLTQPLTEELRKDGVDLRSAEGQAATLNTTQRRLLAAQFRRLAVGFRLAANTPGNTDERAHEEGDQ